MVSPSYSATASTRVSLQFGTRVRISTGRAVEVENLVEGDSLLGPDGQPRPISMINRGRGDVTTLRFLLRASSQEIISLVGEGPVSLKRANNRYDLADEMFKLDSSTFVERVEAMLGPLPQAKTPPAAGEPRTVTYICTSFPDALRNGISVLRSVQRGPRSKSKFEKALNGLSGMKITQHAIFVGVRSTREYKTWTWDPSFAGGHGRHPVIFCKDEEEARTLSHKFAASQAGTENLFNLKQRCAKAKRNGKTTIKIDSNVPCLYLFWDKGSLKRGEHFVMIKDQQKKKEGKDYTMKFSFPGTPTLATARSLALASGVSHKAQHMTKSMRDLADFAGQGDTLSGMRMERNATGVDFEFEDVEDLPVHPFLVGIFVGDFGRPKSQENFRPYLRRKLAPLTGLLMRQKREEVGWQLDIDPLQEHIVDSMVGVDPEATFYQLVHSDDHVDDGADELTDNELDAILDHLGEDKWSLWERLKDLHTASHVPDAYLRASREDRYQLLAGVIEGCVATVYAPKPPKSKSSPIVLSPRMRLYHPGWSAQEQADLRSLALSLGIAAQHYRLARNGFDAGFRPFDFVELEGSFARIPCRLAAWITEFPCPPRDLVQIASAVHDEQDRDEHYVSFSVGGDGRFLREDYLVLGGTISVQ